MARYIDADRLDEIVQDLNEHYEVPITRYEYKRIDGVLFDFPTADVVEVKHGEWLDHQDGRWIYAKCSVCGTIHDTKTNFCPNCGADMRERRDDEQIH